MIYVVKITTDPLRFYKSLKDLLLILIIFTVTKIEVS